MGLINFLMGIDVDKQRKRQINNYVSKELEKNGNDTVNFNNIGTDLNDDHAILSVVFDITKISDKEYSIDCGIDKLSLK